MQLEGGAYVLVDKATGNTVPELTINEKGEWSRTYILQGGSSTNKEFSVHGKLSDLTVSDNGIDSKAWKLVGNEWQRKVEKSNGAEIKLTEFSMAEMV